MTKTVKASNELSCNADLPGNTGTKNDITEHVMENSPTEDEKIQGEKGDESKNSDDMSAPLITEASADMSMVSKNSDTEKHRLGVPKLNHFAFSVFFCLKLIFGGWHPPRKL